MAKDHDLLQPKTNNVLKVGPEASRPHADGCVGCRRDGTCISCGNPKTRAQTFACISGACGKCCAKIHKHANDTPADLVMGESK